ncbi:MAG: M48 family metallopeptidase [SAR324 cluster bacterium]
MTAWLRWGFVTLLALETAIEMGLAWLNLRHSARHGAAVPAPLADAYSAEDARLSQAYVQARGRLELLSVPVGAVLLAGVLLSGALGWWDGWVSAHLAGWAAPHRFVVFLLGVALPFGIVSLPFSVYRTFGIEARFGFNRQTWALWLRDRSKGLALAALIGLPLLYAVWGFMALTGAGWWLWLFAFLTAWQLILVWLYPAVIARWFNRFTPLPAGDLRARVESLARRAGFRMGGIFVMDAGRRSTHSNAYFTGLVRPRIVLFDTLIGAMTPQETEAVLAHEIGHWRAGHVRRTIGLTLALQLAGLFVLSRAAAWPPLFEAFGLAAPGYHGAIALAALAGGTVTFWLGPLLALLSRRHEYQADAYARKLVGQSAALRTALVKLGRDNLANLAPHPWYSAYHYSHPTLPERLAALERGPAP